ncbi:uncharacterized protein LOC119598696 [Penaeus monodon]|uniref:uncharacterized protein LOC119598696 n=1 Tax=Penaeus monodon TaxID=6687 RepID=UPI0018A73010|nr:uncharacterized protein LOC119598696 [Penaeus monodon]
MSRAAVARSPTTDRLHSLHDKSHISKSRGLNENILWRKPGNISEILRDHALSGKPKNFVRISGKPTTFTHSSWKPINNSHTLWESRNSTHTPWESHNSKKLRNFTDTPWNSTNNPQTLWEPRNSAHPPWESHTSGKPRSYTLTSWEPISVTSTPGKPENSTHLSGKSRRIPDLIPLKTPTKERDQRKEDRASSQEVRHPSKRRNSLGYGEKYQQESLHPVKNTEQTGKAKVRLDAMFEKENHNRKCINESTGTPTSVIARDLGKKGKLSLNKSSMFLKCYTCGKRVKDIYFEEHLFFGESECTQCNWKISSCEAFRENKIDQIMGNSTCLHTLTYCMTPSEYIVNNLSQESPHELDRSKLTSYVYSLKRLEGSDPWKKAIDQCVKFVEGETSQPSEANEDHLHASKSEAVFRVPSSKHEVKNSPSLAYEDGDLILSQSYDIKHLNDAVQFEVARDYPEVTMERSPEMVTEYSTSSLPHRQTNADTCSGSLVSDVASQSTNLSDVDEVVGGLSGAEKRIIETPSNGHYLIVRHAIEECPMCYTEFCPSRFTVNINTFLLSTVCIGCDLTVYIIFDPPDGSAPKIFIETESSPREKQKKRKPSAKDFFKS